MKATLPLWLALFGLLGLFAMLPPTLQGPAYPLLALLAALAVATWVVRDAARLRLREYETSLAWRPSVLFIVTAALWIVVLPWYLTVREGIEAGRVPRRSGGAAA